MPIEHSVCAVLSHFRLGHLEVTHRVANRFAAADVFGWRSLLVEFLAEDGWKISLQRGKLCNVSCSGSENPDARHRSRPRGVKKGHGNRSVDYHDLYPDNAHALQPPALVGWYLSYRHQRMIVCSRFCQMFVLARQPPLFSLANNAQKITGRSC